MRTIVISGVNLVNGGPYTIIRNCLDSLSNSIISSEYHIIALVHKKELFPKYGNIEIIEFPKAKKHYIYRIYYEYFYFKKLSKRLKPRLWISLHDMSPNVVSDIQAVYMHNASVFLKVPHKISKHIVFSSLYKYVYRINIHSNKFLIVQQNWLRNSFSELFQFPKENIIVARPVQEKKIISREKKEYEKREFTFVYPSFPRSFKNFEVVCEAVKILVGKGVSNFRVKLTLDGTENVYASSVVQKYGNISNIQFVGLINPTDMGDFYLNSDCLLFPSNLESWGLPISEYKQYGRPMILVDLPYAHETASGLSKIAFFQPNNAKELSERMSEILKGETTKFKDVPQIELSLPYTNSWNELFNYILNEG